MSKHALEEFRLQEKLMSEQALDQELERLQARLSQAEFERLQHLIRDIEDDIIRLRRSNVETKQSLERSQEELEAIRSENYMRKLSLKTLNDYIDNLPTLRKLSNVCQCGCGETLIQPDSGRKKKFVNATHRKRYSRMLTERKLAEKNLSRKVTKGKKTEP